MPCVTVLAIVCSSATATSTWTVDDFRVARLDRALGPSLVSTDLEALPALEAQSSAEPSPRRPDLVWSLGASVAAGPDGLGAGFRGGVLAVDSLWLGVLLSGRFGPYAISVDANETRFGEVGLYSGAALLGGELCWSAEPLAVCGEAAVGPELVLAEARGDRLFREQASWRVGALGEVRARLRWTDSAPWEPWLAISIDGRAANPSFTVEGLPTQAQLPEITFRVEVGTDLFLSRRKP